MKKTVLLLLLIIATVKTTNAFIENPALFYIDLLKSKTRMKAENGEYAEWKKPEKTDNMMGIYQELGGDGNNVIKMVNMKKKVLFHTYTYSDTNTDIKDDIQYMTFECMNKYNEPVRFIVSYYPSSASMSTAKWLKVNEISKTYEREYEAKYTTN